MCTPVFARCIYNFIQRGRSFRPVNQRSIVEAELSRRECPDSGV